MSTALFAWCRSLVPAPLNTSPQEWLRAAGGVAIVLLVTLAAGLWLFPLPLTLHLAGPAAASAMIRFAASSSHFAQPWAIFAGNLTGALVGISLGLSDLDGATASLLAACLGFGLLLVLRCPHPPACALAVVFASGGLDVDAAGYGLLLPVAGNSLLLLLLGWLYGHLTGHPSARPRQARENRHHTADPRPSERLSFTSEDVDQALREFGDYVDVTRDDLQRLIKQTERHALRRSMGEVSAADIMSRDLYWSTPDTFIEQALATLQQHRLRALPVVDGDSRRLLGIVTLVDLLEHFQPSPARAGRSRLHFQRGTRLSAIMSTPVQAVRADAHMADLVYMLCDHGLHCLPVVDEQQGLIGMITQTDLIAALYSNWLKHLPD